MQRLKETQRLILNLILIPNLTLNRFRSDVYDRHETHADGWLDRRNLLLSFRMIPGTLLGWRYRRVVRCGVRQKREMQRWSHRVNPTLKDLSRAELLSSAALLKRGAGALCTARTVSLGATPGARSTKWSGGWYENWSETCGRLCTQQARSKTRGSTQQQHNDERHSRNPIAVRQRAQGAMAEEPQPLTLASDVQHQANASERRNDG
jgi:hypothetical protein